MKQHRIGVDLGGTGIRVGLVDKDNRLLCKGEMPTNPIGRPWQAVVSDMAALISRVLEEGGVPAEACAGIGVGSTGIIDDRRGRVVFENNLGWENVPLLDHLARYFSLPMSLANDADCALLGEAAAGAAAGVPNVVMLTLGTGVGAGVLIGGRLQGGGPGRMEYGHTVIAAGGELCHCGRRGCLEAYASATALIRDTRRAALGHPGSMLLSLCGGDPEAIDGKTAFAAARLGDSAARAVVERYIESLGIAVVNAVNIWRPDLVLLGGGIAGEESLLPPLAEMVARLAYAEERGHLPLLRRAQLGTDAGMVGAAALISAVP